MAIAEEFLGPTKQSAADFLGAPKSSIATRFTQGNQPTMAGDLQDVAGSLPGAIGQFAAHAAASVPGALGNVEQLVRAVPNIAAASMGRGNPVSQQPLNPFTSQVVANAMTGGEPANPAEQAASFAGDILGPQMYGKLASNVIGPLLKYWAGLRSGVGPAPIQEAFNAGAEGGSKATVLKENMRGQAPLSDAVDAAKDALSQLYKERSDAYQQAINSGALSDPKVLDFKPIDKAIRDAAQVGMYKGQTLSGSADKVWNKIEGVVDDWRQATPQDFHTVEGLDALKKKINNLVYEEDLRNVTQPHSPGAAIVGKVKRAITAQIQAQAPGYTKLMGDYAQASDELQNIERSLSIGDKPTIDTSLGKLQSIMRNDVNSRFGQRAAYGARLNQANPTLMPTLAGQSLNAVYPRGLNKLLASGEAAASFLHPGAIPALAADMASSSPRLVGETAFGLGKLSRPFQQAPFGLGGAANVGGLPNISPAQLSTISPALIARLLSIREPVAQPQ